MAAIVGCSLLAQAEPVWPPLYPGAKKEYSAEIQRWQLKLLGGLVIDDDHVRHMLDYLAGLPGDLEFKRLKLRGDPRPTVEQVHEFYSGWAAQQGYHLLLESWVRGDDPGISDLFHKPGRDGGALYVQVRGNRMAWLFQPGHVPVGPLAGEWMDLPTVPPDPTPPKDTPSWTQRGDLPPIDADKITVRLELDRWEIDSVTGDLARRASVEEVAAPLGTLLLAGPEMCAPVRHIWYLGFSVEPTAHAALLEPWTRWADQQGWPLLAEGTTSAGQFTLRLKPETHGGVLVTLENGQDVQVAVFDGGPKLEAVDKVLRATAEAARAAKKDRQ
jgi:hypothetical protein